jgi:hypothetical protein
MRSVALGSYALLVISFAIVGLVMFGAVFSEFITPPIDGEEHNIMFLAVIGGPFLVLGGLACGSIVSLARRRTAGYRALMLWAGFAVLLALAWGAHLGSVGQIAAIVSQMEYATVEWPYVWIFSPGDPRYVAFQITALDLWLGGLWLVLGAATLISTALIFRRDQSRRAQMPDDREMPFASA